MAAFCITLALAASCDAVPPNESWRLGVAPHSPVPALPKANAVVIADFNADARPDLAVINGNPGELLVLLNRADGPWEARAAGRMQIGATASGIVAADVNGDAKSDLVVCFHDRDEVAVVLGKQNGEFGSPSLQKVVRRSQGNPHVHNLALADLNGDRHLDVVVAQADDNCIAWALGDGKGGFQPSDRTLQAGQHPYTITVADFNGDGRPDCASPNAESNDLTIGLNDGSGGFIAPAERGTNLPQRPLALAAGDMNADGHVDLVCNSDEQQRQITLFIGNGQGGFTRSQTQFTGPARCYGQVVADINGDGMLDLIAPCIDRSSVLVWVAENPAGLQFRRVEFETPGTDSQVLAVGDVNGDGTPDVVSAGWARSTITILMNSHGVRE